MSVTRVALTVGRETFELDLVNTIQPDGRSFRLRKGPLMLVAELYVVHEAICPARLPTSNEASGRCTCGGQEAFETLLTVPPVRKKRSA